MRLLSIYKSFSDFSCKRQIVDKASLLQVIDSSKNCKVKKVFLINIAKYFNWFWIFFSVFKPKSWLLGNLKRKILLLNPIRNSYIDFDLLSEMYHFMKVVRVFKKADANFLRLRFVTMARAPTDLLVHPCYFDVFRGLIDDKKQCLIYHWCFIK